jgi:N,N'-diacetylchitobiose transport system substrate-binding protein
MHARRTTTILLALCLIAAGCSGGSGSSGKAGKPAAQSIKVWIMQPGTPALEQFFTGAERDFEAANPGRTVDITFVQWAQAHQQFVSSLGAGTLPDLAEMGTTWNPEFAAVGALGEVGAGGDGYVPALLDSATVDGKRYGLPWYAGARAFIYRKDVLASLGLQPPTTWDELVTVGREIRKKTDLDAFGVFGKGTHIFLPMIWQAGGEIATQKDGRWTAAIDSPEAVRAIQFYSDLFSKEKFAPAGALNWNSLDVRSAFANGDLAMMVGGAWDVEAILKSKPELQDKIGTSLLPAGPAGKREAFAGGSNLAIFESSRNKALARQFADFLLAPERVRDFSAQLGFLPGSTAGLKASAATEDALHTPFRTQLEQYSRSYPASPKWGTFEGENLFVTAVQEVMQGKKTAAEALKAVAQRMNEGFAAA